MIRLGNWQRMAARRLTRKPQAPRRFGGEAESEKIYARLVEIGIARAVDNKPRGSAPLNYPVLYARGPEWGKAAEQYGWDK